MYHVNYCLFQRIGKYDQHSSDQLDAEKSPVEYLRVSVLIRNKNIIKHAPHKHDNW